MVQQIAISEVDESGATIPPLILSALGASPGDKVAFVEHDDGSISLAKASAMPTKKQPISDFIGVFATGEQRTLEEELALLRDMRYGDELDEDIFPSLPLIVPNV